MSNRIVRIPITTTAQLDMLDEGEVLEGYRDGLENAPSPGNNRSTSYWHGWRNGMVDGKHAKTDSHQMTLANEAVRTGYLKKLGR